MTAAPASVMPVRAAEGAIVLSISMFVPRYQDEQETASALCVLSVEEEGGSWPEAQVLQHRLHWAHPVLADADNRAEQGER